MQAQHQALEVRLSPPLLRRVREHISTSRCGLQVAQREMESLRETLRLQDQQVKSTMQQVTDGALRAEGHKSEIVRVSQRHSESERRMQDVHEREVVRVQVRGPSRLGASEPTVALPQESLRRELARLESDLDAQAVGSPALLPFAF